MPATPTALEASFRRLLIFVRCVADDDGSPWQEDARGVLRDVGDERPIHDHVSGFAEADTDRVRREALVEGARWAIGQVRLRVCSMEEGDLVTPDTITDGIDPRAVLSEKGNPKPWATNQS